MCVSLSHSQGLADATVIAKVNNSVWDLDRPLEENCSLQLLKFDDDEAKAVSTTSRSFKDLQGQSLLSLIYVWETGLISLK